MCGVREVRRGRSAGAARIGRSASCEPSLRDRGATRASALVADGWTRIAASDRCSRDLAVPERDTEGGGRLGQRHPQVVVQDDERARARARAASSARSRRSRSATSEAMSPTVGPSSGVSSTSIGRRRRCRAASMQALHGESMEPGVEPVGVAQPRQVPPGPHQRLLDRVARELRVPEDESGGRVQPRDGRAGPARRRRHDRLARARSTSPRWSTVTLCESARPRWSRSTGYGVRRHANCSPHVPGERPTAGHVAA